MFQVKCTIWRNVNQSNVCVCVYLYCISVSLYNRNCFQLFKWWKFNWQSTVMSLIIRTIQLFKHPLLFPGKMRCIPTIQTSTFQSNIQTPTPCRARSGVAERLQDLDNLCGTPTECAERLLAFDSLCGATAMVTERLLAYYHGSPRT